MQAEYTIDELARVADTTVRSVRVYHERGLLPSPEVRGRIGYYGAEHLNRLQTISRLLSRGMKLSGIRELLEAWDRGDGLAEVLGVPQTDALPIPAQAPDAVSAATRRLRPSPGPAASYTTPTEHLIAAGLPPAEADAMVRRLRLDCTRIADRYADELARNLSTRTTHSAGFETDTSANADADIVRHLITRTISELIGERLARLSAI